MNQTITYKGKLIKVDVNYPIRKRVCECCGKQGILTCLHHWRYKYSVAEVRAEPMLALEYTNELDFNCHKPANSLRIINETKPEIITKLKQLEEQQNGH